MGRVDGPCPAWPWWREWVEEARRQILALAEHKGEPPVAVRRPIAVIDSGLPIEEVIARLNASLREALASPEVVARIASDGAEPAPTSPQEYAQDIDRDEMKWAPVVLEAGQPQ